MCWRGFDRPDSGGIRESQRDGVALEEREDAGIQGQHQCLVISWGRGRFSSTCQCFPLGRQKKDCGVCFRGGGCAQCCNVVDLMRAQLPLSPYFPFSFACVLFDSVSGKARSRSKIPSRLRILNSFSAVDQVRARLPTPRSRSGVYFGFSLVEPVRLHFVGIYGIWLILWRLLELRHIVRCLFKSVFI